MTKSINSDQPDNNLMMIAFNENLLKNTRIIVLSADYALNTRVQKTLQKEHAPVIGFYDVDDAIEWEDDNRTILKFYVIDAISPNPHWKTILDNFHAKDLFINCMLLTDRAHSVSNEELRKYGLCGVYVMKDKLFEGLGDYLKDCIRGSQNKDDVPDDKSIQTHQLGHSQPDLIEEVIRIGRNIQARRENAQLLNERHDSKAASEKIASDLLANISNDITGPLNTMITMARDLEKTKLSHEQHNLLKSIIIAAGNLRNVCNNALDYADLEVNKPEVVYHNFHLVVLLEELLLLIKPQADAKKISMHLDIGEGVPEYVFGDKSKIQQVVTHVLGHLIKSSEKTQIELSVQAMVDQPFDKMLGFTFKTSFCQSLKAGSQAKKTPAHAKREDLAGLGTGLYIAKTLVEAMGGKLVIGRLPNRELNMSFSIPLMESSAPVIADEKPSTGPHERKKQLKVLLAEDDVINQMYLAGFLRMQGWEVDTAYNGLTVMELFKPEKYDLIILDGQMPAMDGFETAKKIRQTEGNETHTPILAISGFAIPGDRQKFMDAGMDDYLPKPINEDELLRTIHLLTA